MLEKDVISSYDVLMEKQQKLFDQMSNLGREKDYRVQKIEKKYESQIDALIRKQQAIALQIEIAKRYVQKTNVVDAEIAVTDTEKHATKKKA